MKNNKITITIESERELKKSYGEEMVSILSKLSPYARIFNEDNVAWSSDLEYNLAYLKGQQDFLNDKLRYNRFLFLNDVYETLGFSKTKIGAVVGWVYDEENPIGDNFVDFGIFQFHNKNAVNCKSGYFILDFNVDGEILSKI